MATDGGVSVPNLHELRNRLRAFEVGQVHGRAGLDLNADEVVAIVEEMGVRTEQVGLLIDGVEFIPHAVMLKHLPFAVPPGQSCEALYALRDEA